MEHLTKHIRFIVFIYLFLWGSSALQVNAQTSSGLENFEEGKIYALGQIRVEGNRRDAAMIILRSGLAYGDKIRIPGDEISLALKKLWEASLFSDVKILIEEIQGDRVGIVIRVKEKPQINNIILEGIKKSDREDLDNALKPVLFKTDNENTRALIQKIIKDYYEKEGRYTPKMEFSSSTDSLYQYTELEVEIDRGPKVKVGEIVFVGNRSLPDKKLRKALGEIKRYQWFNPFRTSDFVTAEYEAAKKGLIAEYQKYGFRDVRLLTDSIQWISEKRLQLKFEINEGKRYYFREIVFDGNTKYTDEQLHKILGIKKGDVYNTAKMEQMLMMDPQGGDVSSLYLDDGYLFFNVQPTEASIVGDSVDVLIKIYEGSQARIGKVTVVGNTKTSDQVILREIYTKPGELFKRSDIILSQRELANLKFFNPEALQVNPSPNPSTGTVDVEYVVEEQPSDQFELQGGFGNNTIIGTLGLTFTNFSTKNFFDKRSWQPIPSGDGQSISLRAQSSGRFYTSFSFSFVEPWLGGKKPRALSFSAYHTRLNATTTDGHQYITGVSLGLGNRLKWPDNFFRLQANLGYQYYDVMNYPGLNLSEGFYNNVNLKLTLSRSSIDQPIYPRSGSELTLSAQGTPPISLFNGNVDYSTLSDKEKFKWMEFAKFKVHAGWYTKIVEKLVLYNKVNFGFLAAYNREVGIPPFERFYMGGSGLTGFNIDGREIIPLRGYDDASYNNVVYKGNAENGGVAAVKYTMELRYPISLDPQATIFALGFLEAGNTYSSISQFDLYDVKRAAGVGVRLFLPMLGMLGFDYGWPFNPANNTINPNLFDPTQGQFTFTFGGNMSGW